MLRSSRATGRLFGCLVAALLALSAPAIASAATPSVIGSVSDANADLSGATAVAVSGQYAYAVSGYGGELTAINIANPANPIRDGSAAPPASSTVASMMGASNVTVSGGYAFVVSRNVNSSPSSNDTANTGNDLNVFDVHTTPGQPVYVGQVYDPTRLFGAYGIAVSGNYAYVAYQGALPGSSPPGPSTSTGGFSVIDLTSLTGPTIVGNIDNNSLPGAWAGSNVLGAADGVAVSGSYAYVAAWGKNAITVIDVSNPAAPQIVTSLQDPTHLHQPSDVAVSGSHLFVSDYYGNGGVTAVDISTPASPAVVGFTTQPQLAGAYRIRVAGSDAYVAGSVSNTVVAIDISNPASLPQSNAYVTDAAHLNSVTGLDVIPGGRYVVTASPRQPSETKTIYPPYPTQAGGPTNTGTVSVVDLDPNPVKVSITTPANGATYMQGQSVSAAYSCLPGGTASVSSCSGTVPAGQPINTSALGSHTFTVTGTDAWGQTGTQTVSYTVATKPTASFSDSPSPATTAGSVSFDGTGSKDANPGATITGYAWSFGDGKTATGAHTSHRYAKAGTYTVTLTVTDSLGQSGSVQHTVRVLSASSRPRFSYVRQLARRWTEPGTPTVNKLPVGTVFWFTLNTKAKVTLTFWQLSSGRKSGKRCVAPTKANRHHAACVRKRKVGTLKPATAKGGNAIRFRGKIGHHRLAPGTYRVVITATVNGLSSHTTLTFTIVR